ncbi:hypothetical protein [Hymenobacter sp. GOD-10R]|uniref:hypothetical protein n=1 Tax=Hymenobacter sp. GOD-10R TaxID=3093922 RepID=UPI002D798630|nr:hypothetical protein [Hymenobacter sp. GOD-10R]WRQ27700.1 hypothetical protein SD425_21755 [Hymenobacter sp. GOD-10R]
MSLDLQTNAVIDTVSLPAATVRRSLDQNIPDSKTVTGLEVRLSRVLVKDNRTAKVWPFPGYADVYLLLIVFDDLHPEPQTINLSGFTRIDDNEDLPVDKTAYYWKQNTLNERAPSQVHLLLSVMKSKERLRDTGTILTQAKDSADYQSLVSAVVATIANAPAQIATLLLQLGAVVGQQLHEVEDKPLFTQVISFTDINGDFDTLGKTPIVKMNQYVQTTLTLVVRDPAREPNT